MKHFYLLLNVITVAMGIVLLMSVFKPSVWTESKNLPKPVPFPSYTGARVENIKPSK